MAADSSVTVQYTVTNQSSKVHKLVMLPINGVQQVTTGMGVCGASFTLGFHQSCTLTVEINGSLLQQTIEGGPLVCQANADNSPNQNSCYQPSPNNRLNVTPTAAPITLSSSVSALALSVNCATPGAPCAYSNAALTGNARLITITNTSTTLTAVNVGYDVTDLPTGTGISPVSCNIAPGDTCVFTVTPGKVASTVTGAIHIAGTNTNSLSISAQVLTYGSTYQSGYVFAVDDTTLNTTSVSGKVAALADQSLFIPWDPGCPGSCIGPIAADSYLDGLTNTANAYNAMSSVYAPNSYAVGLCDNVLIDGYVDWYLPAICEMGYDFSPSPCGDASTPTLQNMQSNLVDNGIVALNGSFWSSTQIFGTSTLAIYNDFSTPGNQPGDVKEQPYAVRCVRIMS